jgi:hypothetical protein
VQVTRISQAAHLPVRGQSDGVATLAFHHRLTGWRGPYWAGCSHLLPGSRIEVDDEAEHTAVLVVDGEVHVIGDGADAVLCPMDSAGIAAGERCTVRNDSNRVATVVLVVSVASA